jgi:hypothetical protein
MHGPLTARGLITFSALSQFGDPAAVLDEVFLAARPGQAYLVVVETDQAAVLEVFVCMRRPGIQTT